MKDEELAYEDNSLENEKNYITISVDLGKLEFRTFEFSSQDDADFLAWENYDWESLEKSIKEHGILKPLHVIEIPQATKYKVKEQFKYRVRDGNHRIHILRKLYPSNYKVKVKVF